MTMQPYRDANDARVATALANGERLHVGVFLSYVAGSSNKFWSGVWAEDQIAINFGPHNAMGQFKLHRMVSADAAAVKFWDLLRSKTAKGYAIVDAAVMITETNPVPLPLGDVRAAQNMLSVWTRVREDRAANPDRLPATPWENRVLSPRTPKQGGPILMSVTDPAADRATLLAAWDAPSSEAFMPKIVISHPNCPDEARLLTALAGDGNLFPL